MRTRKNSSYSTIDFVQRAIIYFGYAPDMIQTDYAEENTMPKFWQLLDIYDCLYFFRHSILTLI